ncbi:MAG TPA: hypothetical protein VLN26_05055, partial [Gaiellaceae bacterium]|nr:hypothetical protein [Gaiellaceae bacterium]
PQVVAGVGAAGALTAAVALVLRRPSVFPIGIVGVGAGYAVFLALRHGTVDTRAPFVAAAIFAAAETGFWSVEPLAARATRPATVRRALLIAGSALFAALAGSVMLVISSGVRGGVPLEAVGVAAAVATAAVVAVVAARAGGSSSS